MKKEKIINIFKENKFPIICFLISFIISIIIASCRTFCDEADIISASWLMSKGYNLYSDIFCHHMPIPYWFLQIFHILHVDSIVTLRVLFAIITQSYFIFLYLFFRKKISKYIIPLTSVIYFLMRNIMFQNIILADSFVALGFFTIFLEILINHEMNFKLKDKILISFATMISFGSSLIAVYPLAIFFIYYIVKRVILYIKDKKNVKANFIEDLKFMIIVLIPFIIMLLYFILTKTLDDFIENGIKFNTEYYSIFNEESTPISLIIKQITKLPEWGFEQLKYGTINLYLYKFKTRAVFGGINFVIFIIWSIVSIYKKRNNAILLVLFSYFCYMRDDFHASTFFILCNYFLAEGIICSIKKLKDKKTKIDIKSTIIKATVISFVLAYSMLYMYILVMNNYRMIKGKSSVLEYGKDYKKIIELTTDETDKIWVAPLMAELYFVTQREPANENIFYLPWQAIKPGLNQQLVNDLEENKTKLIIYDSNVNIWGIKVSSYANMLEQYLKENYFKIDEKSNVYFRNENKQEIINILVENNLIRRK